MKLTNKLPKKELKEKAPTKKELVKLLETLDSDFVDTDISRIRISTLKLLIQKLG